MLNQVMLVGSIALLPVATNSGKKDTAYRFSMMVDEDEEFSVNIYIWPGLANAIIEKYHLGDMVAVKGSLQMTNDGYLIVVAEKVSFITTKED